MAKFELKFLDADCNNTYISTNSYFGEGLKQIYIEIGTTDSEEKSFILLDKSTAIKFAKTLRTEINKITDIEKKSGVYIFNK